MSTEKKRLASKLRLRKLRQDPEYRQRQQEARKRTRAKNKEIVNSLKNEPCMDCGNRFPPVCMDFDHVRGVKIEDVADICNRSLETVLTEIDKCDLVCANCHRIRTYNRMRVANPSMHSEVKI